SFPEGSRFLDVFVIAHADRFLRESGQPIGIQQGKILVDASQTVSPRRGWKAAKQPDGEHYGASPGIVFYGRLNELFCGALGELDEGAIMSVIRIIECRGRDDGWVLLGEDRANREGEQQSLTHIFSFRFFVPPRPLAISAWPDTQIPDAPR